MKTEIMNSISGAFYNIGFKLRKHSPEILVVAGVIGTVASAVVACKATTKVSKILEETEKAVYQIHECRDNPSLAEKYTEEDSKKDLAIVYAQTGLKFVKLYAPAVALGVVSISCMLASNNILHKRNAALAAAYAAVDTGFKNYRDRVIERFGNEIDKELRYNIKSKEIEETVIDEKTGKEKNVKQTIKEADASSLYSPYARIFDETNDYWEKDSELNRFFLNRRQAEANNLLRARKRLFLNDVYEMLGFEKTKAGQVAGWIYDPDNPDADSYVDFGMYSDIWSDTASGDRQRAFMNGYEPAIILDFNVQGDVWSSM